MLIYRLVQNRPSISYLLMFLLQSVQSNCLVRLGFSCFAGLSLGGLSMDLSEP